VNAINVKRLITMGACEDQVNAMYDLIGDGDAPLTVEFAVKHAQVFDWDWAAFKLFSVKSLEEFVVRKAPLLTSCYAANDISRVEYKIGLAKLFATIYLKGTSDAEV